MDSDRRQTPNAIQYFWLAHALLLLTIYGSLIPLRYQPIPLDQALEQFRAIPFYDLKLADARGDWVVNMVQYAAVGFCYLAALAVDRRWMVGLLAAVVVVPAGWAVALALEFTQIYFPPRTVSVNDILVECLGIVLGVGAWLLAGQGLTNWLRRFWGRKSLVGLAPQVLPAYLVLLLVVHLMPFDVVFGRAELVEKYQQGRIQLVPFTDLAESGIDPVLNQLKNIAAFLPIGVLLALLPHWSGRSWRPVLWFGLGVALLIELLKLLVYTRYCRVTDILTGTLAVLLGWWLVRRLRQAAVARPLRIESLGSGPLLRLALAWAVLLVLVNWQPFDFTTDPVQFLDSDATLSDEDTSVLALRRVSLAPFVDYYWGSRYQAIDHLVWHSLAFIPLGFLLGLAFGKWERAGVAVTVLAALALGALIEGGRYFIPERHPSVTHLLIHVCGAWLGYKLARHTVHVLRPVPEPTSEPDYAALGLVFATSGPAPQHRSRPRPKRVGLTSPPRGRSVARDAHPSYPREPLLLRCFDALPKWLQFVVICAAGVALAAGLALLFYRMVEPGGSE
jgi:glycopeptide antibiotics resistance protein